MSLKAINGTMHWREMPEMLGILIKTAYQAIIEKSDPFITFNLEDEGVICTYRGDMYHPAFGLLTLNLGVNAARSCVFTEHGIMADIRLQEVAQEVFIPYTAIHGISSRGNAPQVIFTAKQMTTPPSKEKRDVPTTKPTLTVVKQ